MEESLSYFLLPWLYVCICRIGVKYLREVPTFIYGTIFYNKMGGTIKYSFSSTTTLSITFPISTRIFHARVTRSSLTC